MREFVKFMLGGYWNDTDGNTVGGRQTLGFCWLMVFVAVGVPLALFLAYP